MEVISRPIKKRREGKSCHNLHNRTVPESQENTISYELVISCSTNNCSVSRLVLKIAVLHNSKNAGIFDTKLIFDCVVRNNTNVTRAKIIFRNRTHSVCQLCLFAIFWPDRNHFIMKRDWEHVAHIQCTCSPFSPPQYHLKINGFHKQIFLPNLCFQFYFYRTSFSFLSPSLNNYHGENFYL